LRAGADNFLDRSGGYLKNSFVVQAYDWVVPNSTRQDIPFFLEAARESEGQILELGCGTGRVLIPIAREGFNITGVDVSRRMLSVCRRKLVFECADTRSKVRGLINQDMSRFSLGLKFDLVIVPFFTFNYLLSRTDQFACLFSIKKHLTPDGKLILDLPVPQLRYLYEDKYLKEFGDEPIFEMPDGRKGWRKYRIKSRNLGKQIVRVQTIYYFVQPDGRQQRLVNEFLVRYLFASDVEDLLARCGFAIRAMYGGHAKESYSPSSEEMVIIAQGL